MHFSCSSVFWFLHPALLEGHLPGLWPIGVRCMHLSRGILASMMSLFSDVTLQ